MWCIRRAQPEIDPQDPIVMLHLRCDVEGGKSRNWWRKARHTFNLRSYPTESRSMGDVGRSRGQNRGRRRLNVCRFGLTRVREAARIHQQRKGRGYNSRLSAKRKQKIRSRLFLTAIKFVEQRISYSILGGHSPSFAFYPGGKRPCNNSMDVPKQSPLPLFLPRSHCLCKPLTLLYDPSTSPPTKTLTTSVPTTRRLPLN